MFTGIVESMGIVYETRKDNSNLQLTLQCSFAKELSVDQSVAHNGVCLTVVQIDLANDRYTVTAIAETLKRTNLGALKEGDLVNLERCMPATGRFDGHIVQGHVDQTGICTELSDRNGSWLFHFSYEDVYENITVAKGSICVNGVSLTVVDSGNRSFSVALIPYTYAHTNLSRIQAGSIVNLEFDILGKYVARLLAKRS